VDAFWYAMEVNTIGIEKNKMFAALQFIGWRVKR
jgi:hypothetical protein